MKYIAFWLPILTVAIGALMMHAPIVDGWHDLTRDWHRYQLVALLEYAALVLTPWCLGVLVWECWRHDRQLARKESIDV